MATFTATVFSSLSAAAAFVYVADVRTYDEWDPGIRQARQTHGSGPQLGARYELRYRFGSVDYEIVEYVLDHSMTMVGESLGLTSSDTVEVIESDVGCTVTYTADVQLPAPLRLLDPLLQKALDRNGERAADGLAVALQGKRVFEHHEDLDPDQS